MSSIELLTEHAAVLRPDTEHLLENQPTQGESAPPKPIGQAVQAGPLTWLMQEEPPDRQAAHERRDPSRNLRTGPACCSQYRHQHRTLDPTAAFKLSRNPA